MEYLVRCKLSSMIFVYVVPIESEPFLSNSDQLPLYVEPSVNVTNPIKIPLDQWYSRIAIPITYL